MCLSTLFAQVLGLSVPVVPAEELCLVEGGNARSVNVDCLPALVESDIVGVRQTGVTIGLSTTAYALSGERNDRTSDKIDAVQVAHFEHKRRIMSSSAFQKWREQLDYATDRKAYIAMLRQYSRIAVKRRQYDCQQEALRKVVLEH